MGLPARIAITGLSTFTGGQVAERLLATPLAPVVVGIDVGLPRRLEERIRFHRIDLTEPCERELADALRKEGCDVLLHAAFSTDPRPDLERAHELEVIGSLRVMNAAAAAGVPKLVVASTAEVYGARPTNPAYLDEERALHPDPAAHAVADRAEVESLLRVFATRHPAMVVTSLRPCWIFGPRSRSRVLDHFDRGRVTTVLGHDPLLQCLHEDDHVDAVVRALEVDAPGALNLAGEGVLPLSTLLRLAGKGALPLPAPLLYRAALLESVRRTGDPPRAFYDYLRFPWVVDTERARRLLDFRPAYTTQEAWMSFVVSRRLRSYR